MHRWVFLQYNYSIEYFYNTSTAKSSKRDSNSCWQNESICCSLFFRAYLQAPLYYSLIGDGYCIRNDDDNDDDDDDDDDDDEEEEEEEEEEKEE